MQAWKCHHNNSVELEQSARTMLKNELLADIFYFDTAENELPEVELCMFLAILMNW